MTKANDMIGPYTLVGKLGRGAFGVVWLAEKRTAITTTKVALKLPNEEDVDLETVKREASLWVRASGHPNVLPIIDADIHDEHVIIVSEYAPDGSLSEWLARHGGRAPSVESAAEMGLGILAGLAHLHERGIIHRDLKPDNILLQRETPRLADFGIARILKSTSKSTVASGTPAYMPPEAFDGKRSEQTDLWSAGVVIYQLLTGELPFPHTDITSLLAAIITKEPEPLPDSIPRTVRAVVERALRKNPGERYTSAAEMREALRDAVKGGADKETKTALLPTIVDLPASVTPPEQATDEGRADLTETQRLQLEYWTALKLFLQERGSFLKPPKPFPQYWLPLAIGRANFRLSAFINTLQRRPKSIGVDLAMSGPDAKPHFYLLREQKEAIEHEIGEPLEWREQPNNKESYIRLRLHNLDPTDRREWPTQHAWLQEKLETFHKVFASRIRELDAADYSEDDAAPLPLDSDHGEPSHAPTLLDRRDAPPPATSEPPASPAQPELRPRRAVLNGAVAALILLVGLAVAFSYYKSTAVGNADTPATGGQQQAATANSNTAGGESPRLNIDGLSIRYENIGGELLGIRMVIKHPPAAFVVKVNDRQAELEQPRKVTGGGDEVEVLAKINFTKSFAQIKKYLDAGESLKIEVVDSNDLFNSFRIFTYVDRKALNLDEETVENTNAPEPARRRVSNRAAAQPRKPSQPDSAVEAARKRREAALRALDQ